jgi:hypothetical protein
MKPDADQKSTYSVNHSNGSHNNNNNNNVSLFMSQRKGAVHDFTQIIVENCLKVNNFFI